MFAVFKSMLSELSAGYRYNRCVLITAILLSCGTSVNAALVFVDWDIDGTLDGMSTGNIGGHSVSLNSTDGSLNGGQAFQLARNYANQAGSDDVPGIPNMSADVVGLDWISNQTGFATLTFGATLTNPILLFDAFDSHLETLDFPDTLLLSVLDQSVSNFSFDNATNVVSASGNSNSNQEGVSLQLLGNFNSISFNTFAEGGDSLGFTLMVDENNINAIPEPSAFLCIAVVGIVYGSRCYFRMFRS